jgi:hypothetical protein
MSLVRLSRRLQSGNSSNRKAMEQWWFSSGEISLYLETETFISISSRRLLVVRSPQRQFSLSIYLIDVIIARVIQIVTDARNQKNENIHVTQTGNEVRVPCYCIHLQKEKVKAPRLMDFSSFHSSTKVNKMISLRQIFLLWSFFRVFSSFFVLWNRGNRGKLSWQR